MMFKIHHDLKKIKMLIIISVRLHKNYVQSKNR